MKQRKNLEFSLKIVNEIVWSLSRRRNFEKIVEPDLHKISTGSATLEITVFYSSLCKECVKFAEPRTQTGPELKSKKAI
jgi:hypothetical protein